MRPVTLVVLFLVALTQIYARLEISICGTHRDRPQEELFLHRHVAAKRQSLALSAGAPAARDVGEIAILEDSDGVIARRNDFNLAAKTIRFTPVAAARYRFQTGAGDYDSAAATAGTPISGLGDDATSRALLPFAFSFFGNTYQELFVNSDGNLTFVEGDAASTDRSLGRLTAGPPRIAGLFMDLNPTRQLNTVRVLADATRFVVSWAGVPEYQTGAPQTFQIRLYPDGRIEFAYSGVSILGSDGAVVGMSPGGLLGATSVVSFANDTSGEYSSTVAERFGGTEEIDIVTAAQKFYQTHDDAYDYLVIYNNLGVGACPGSVACETTVRNTRTGYGDVPIEIGKEFGSASRLQAVLNMGQLTQYPRDPAGIVPGRSGIRDTPITVIAHETGHLFLAFASVRNSNDPAARPMLNANLAHWAFTFNSEASLLEGNRIRDNGPATSPRFTTTATVEGYAPLDQYLMGLRTPDEVPPTFLVTGASRDFSFNVGQPGISFDGQRRDIAIGDLVAAEGRRTPDSTVSQRRFRFAFIMIVRQGTTPAQSDLDQVETYRQQFEPFYAKAASDRAAANTALKMSVRLSTFPAAGLLAGHSMTATVSTQKPAPAPVTITLRSQSGTVAPDPSVTIPAGATSATFTLTGVRAGVDEITALPADTRYDSASSSIQVLPSPDFATLKDVSCPPPFTCDFRVGGANPVTLRISDVNELPYPGIRVQASVTGGGSVTPAVAVSDADGKVSFSWTTIFSAGQVLAVRIEDSASVPLFLAGPLDGSFSFSAPVNAASGAQGLSPGGIATIFGANLSSSIGVSAPHPWPNTLAGVRVLLDGAPVPLLYVSKTQINFLVPPAQNTGTAKVTIVSGSRSVDLPVPEPVTLVSPGIFFDAASGYGAILIPGTTQTTREQPATRGSLVEVYATGLGPSGASSLLPQATIGGLPAKVDYHGLAPGYLGLYQVNVQIPPDVPPGEQSLFFTVGGVLSNTVKIGIR